jgi:signal transduction histidine kinase
MTAAPLPFSARVLNKPVEVLPQNQLETDDLRELLHAVSQTTQRLESTHIALHSQVARLQQELAEANAQLRRSRSLAALGEMAAGIAHEVRNPLASIQLYAQILAEDLADRPEQSELCVKINRAVVGLDAIVRDVLSFARETTIHPEHVTAADLFDRALCHCEALVVTHDIEVVREARGDGSFLADGCLLTQAIANVIRNAIEAMVESQSSKKRLGLYCRRKRTRLPDGRMANRVVLGVDDSGPGIPADVIDRVFNPFFTTRKTGTGLGLAIVHRIVDAHGGHVSIAKASAGGTRVELCLPPTCQQAAAFSDIDPHLTFQSQRLTHSERTS